MPHKVSLSCEVVRNFWVEFVLLSTVKKGVWTQAAKISTVGPRIVQGQLLWSAARDISLKTGLWSQGMRFFLPRIAPGLLFSALRQYLEPHKTLSSCCYRWLWTGFHLPRKWWGEEGRKVKTKTRRSAFISRRLGGDRQPQWRDSLPTATLASSHCA